MKKKIGLLAAIAVMLSGCGKRGPLVLEPAKLPKAVAGLEIRQVGDEVEISWEYPALLSDEKTPLQNAQVRSVSVYHLARPAGPDAFEKKGKLLARFKPSELRVRGRVFTVSVSFKGKQLKDQEHAFALGYQYGRARSPLSPVRRITTLTPPGPVRDLKVAREGKVVVLRWSPPQADGAAQPLAGFRVYRRIVPAAPEGEGRAAGAFAPLRAKAVKGEYFEDLDTGVDGDYEYRVSSLLSERIESAPSAVVRIGVQDTFPPDVPANLVTFTGPDHVFLTWEAPPDPDLDHYVVYRKKAGEEEFKPLDAAVTDNFFRDRQVRKGQTYFYSVAAVDRKGNESETSRPARQLFE